MGRCDGNRPTTRDNEKEVKARAFEVADLAEDMRVVLTVYAGCAEGPRVTFATIGPDRAVLADGTVEQIANYAVGKPVQVGGQTYQRNVGRKQEDAVARIGDEMYGTGEIAEKARGNGFGGFTVTVNGNNVTKDSVLNQWFTKVEAKQEGKPVLDAAGKPIEFFGGVEMIVSAVITPGASGNVQYGRMPYNTIDRIE